MFVRFSFAQELGFHPVEMAQTNETHSTINLAHSSINPQLDIVSQSKNSTNNKNKQTL